MVGLFSILYSSELAITSSNYTHIQVKVTPPTSYEKSRVTYEFANGKTMLIVVVDDAASVVAAQQ